MTIKDNMQPVVLLFAGQGNPCIGMGADLWDINPLTRHIWDCASDISGKDIRRLCQQGPMNRLTETTAQQIAVTAINITLFTLCRGWLEHRQLVAACGHSVGEYSALYAAGVITLETLFRLVHFRATLMHELSLAHKGSMLVVNGIDNAAIRTLIARTDAELDISCDNSCKQQVVGGSARALAEFKHLLITAGYSPLKSGVSGAWHTRLMQEGCQPMRGYLQKREFLQPQCEVIMNVTARAAYEAQEIKDNLALHLTHTVKWTDSIARLLDSAVPHLFVEMSHKPWLCQLLKNHRSFNPGHALHCRTILSMPGGQA